MWWSWVVARGLAVDAEIVRTSWRVSASRSGMDLVVEGLSVGAAIDLVFDLFSQGVVEVIAEERAVIYAWVDGKGLVPRGR